MAKRAKKPEEASKGAPLWMATFSDLVTLMMAFFVMLVAMANFDDVSRVSAVIESIQTALGVDGFDSKLVGTSTAEAFTEAVRRDDTVQPIVAKLREAFQERVSDDFVRMIQEEQELRIRIDDRVFFQPGSTVLHPSAYALIADIAKVLKPVPVDIRIEGFADGSGSEQANWELSLQRALAVVLALREKGPIEGKRLEAVAHGEFHPGATIGEAAEWSRRVEIVLNTKDLAGAQSASRWLE